MSEGGRGIDTALVELIVREVIRRLRAGVGAGGPCIGCCQAGEDLEDRREPQIGLARGCRENCKRRPLDNGNRGSDKTAWRADDSPGSGAVEGNAIVIRKNVVAEEDIKAAVAHGARRVRIDRRAIVTPLARDTAREKKLAIELVDL